MRCFLRKQETGPEAVVRGSSVIARSRLLLWLAVGIGVALVGSAAVWVWPKPEKAASPIAQFVLPHDKPAHYNLFALHHMLWVGETAFVQSFSMGEATTPSVEQALTKAMDSVSFTNEKGHVRVALDAPLAKGIKAYVNGTPIASVRVVKTAIVEIRDGRAFAVSGEILPFHRALEMKSE